MPRSGARRCADVIEASGAIVFDSPQHYTGWVKFSGTLMGYPLQSGSKIEGMRKAACTSLRTNHLKRSCERRPAPPRESRHPPAVGLSTRGILIIDARPTEAPPISRNRRTGLRDLPVIEACRRARKSNVAVTAPSLNSGVPHFGQNRRCITLPLSAITE